MSDTFNIIKKNSAWNLLNILLIAVSVFSGLYLTKKNLSPETFVRFNLQLNTVTFLNALVIGWFTQSITRFAHLHSFFFTRNKISFIALLIGIVVGIPCFFLWLFFIGFEINSSFPLFFLVSNSAYTALLIGLQASLNFKRAAFCEFVRNIVLLSLLGLPLVVRIKATEQYYWLSWLCSYFVAFIFLFSSYPARPALAVDPVLGEKQVTYKMILRQMVSFGLPITVWQVISFLMLNADRWYLVKFKFDSALTSDYLALSDVMMRGSGFMFSPLVSAAYPMISRIFDKGDFREVKRLILQILKWEVVILCVALLGFFILHSILFSTLNFKTRDYSIFMIGVVLLIVHSLWQMSAMLHKVAELNLISSLMVRGILLSCLISYTALYFIIIPKTTIQVLFCFSLGILSYFIYAIVLFRKYLPSYVQK